MIIIVFHVDCPQHKRHKHETFGAGKDNKSFLNLFTCAAFPSMGSKTTSPQIDLTGRGLTTVQQFYSF